jgi:hypothetical protein
VLNLPVRGTDSFALPNSVDELRSTYAALSIQTTPEQAQGVINFIKSGPLQSGTTMYYQVLGPGLLSNGNCTTVCRDALKAAGIIPRSAGSISPVGFWSYLYGRFGNSKLMVQRQVSARYGETRPAAPSIPMATGVDYGFPRYGINPFDFIMKFLGTPQVTSTFKPCKDGDANCGN